MSDQKDLKSSGFCACAEEAPPKVISLDRQRQPTIRIPSCRGDGVCRLCGLRASDQFGYNLPCGCYWHLSCGEEQSRTRAQHLSDLLTEALRQLKPQVIGRCPVHGDLHGGDLIIFRTPDGSGETKVCIRCLVDLLKRVLPPVEKVP